MFIWGGGFPVCSAGLMTKTTSWFENHPVVKWTTIVLTGAAIIAVGWAIGATVAAALVVEEVAEEAIAEVVVEIVAADSEAGIELEENVRIWNLRRWAPIP